MTEHLMRMPLYDGISVRRAPDPLMSCGCAAPHVPFWTWTGISQTPPELLAEVTGIGDERLLEAYRQRLTPFEFEVTAPPLTGVFTLPPSILMPNEQDDLRTAVTTPAPPPSEPVTNTENEKPAAIQALRPPPLKYDASFLAQEDSVFSRAVQLVAEVGNDIDRDRTERREAGETAAASQAQLLKQNAEILAAIQRADDNSNKNYELLRNEILQLKDSDLKQDERLKQGDKRFSLIEESITALKHELITRIETEMRAFAEKFEALDRLLAEAREANVTARQASAAPTG